MTKLESSDKAISQLDEIEKLIRLQRGLMFILGFAAGAIFSIVATAIIRFIL